MPQLITTSNIPSKILSKILSDDIEQILPYIPKVKKQRKVYIKKGYSSRKKQSSKKADVIPTKIDHVGENNPMYGKHHSDESKRLIAKGNKKHRQQVGFVDPRWGKNLYMVWLEKYGEEVANEKYVDYKELLSEVKAGYNHPMYGKVAGRNTGSGWKGTYRGKHFRSLKELSFLVNYVDQFKLEAVLVGIEHGIAYEDMYTNKRVYYADYILNNKFMVEIMPDRDYVKTTTNWILKREAAEEYCRLKGWEYKMVIPIKISYSQIRQLMKDYKLQFDEVTMMKYEAYLLKGSHKDIMPA